MKLRHLFENNLQHGVPLPVFRGLAIANDKQVGDAISFPIRKNRAPADSSFLFSALFNMGIEQILGVPEVRKQSAYASTDKSTAQTYAERADSEWAKPGHSGGLVQLHVPTNAVIVFNPSVADSYNIEEEMPELYEWTNELAQRQIESAGGKDVDNLWQSNPIMNRNAYLTTGYREYLRSIVETALPGDQEGRREFLSQLDTFAGMIVDGYQKMSAQEFSDRYANNNKPFEIMICGTDSYVGVVVN